MDNLANITISESDYKSLLLNGAFLDIKIISIKILPNDSEIKDDVTYKALQNEYKKARNKLDDYRFQLTTNKTNIMINKDKHPTEIIQNLDFEIHNLDNLIMQQSNILEINKSKLENLKHQKKSLLNYLNDEN